jgi:hypothetical protein
LENICIQKLNKLTKMYEKYVLGQIGTNDDEAGSSHMAMKEAERAAAVPMDIEDEDQMDVDAVDQQMDDVDDMNTTGGSVQQHQQTESGFQ